MKVLKFGGSSVGSFERIENVMKIIQQEVKKNPLLIVVVSAFEGVTNTLVQMSQQAARGNRGYVELLEKVKNRHREVAKALLSFEKNQEVNHQLTQVFQELEEVLKGLFLLRELSSRSLDFVMSFGERLSAYLISEALKLKIQKTRFVDARDIIKTDAHFGAAFVNYETTNTLIQQTFSSFLGLSIVTGFIGSTDAKETTTLGRGGSDFTASIIGAALLAEVIEIWTDVNGVMTADPKKVPFAFSIEKMTYKEALEMSHFGAKVIHSPTMIPARLHSIPLLIKNTFDPLFAGTEIKQAFPNEERGSICGISSIDQISLLRVEGSGMTGVCGMAERIFGVLAKKEINVILISQGSSEYSICIAILPEFANLAKEALEEEFKLERGACLIEKICQEEGFSIIAVVGEKMRHTPGISGKLFGILGRKKVNVVAIAQGSSELNISIVIKQEEVEKALRAIHEEFFEEKKEVLNLFLVGIGKIGKALLSKLQKNRASFEKERKVDIKVRGITNQTKALFDPLGIPLDQWEERFAKEAKKSELSSFIKTMKQMKLSPSFFIDCTASNEGVKQYASILEEHISIVTPNKKGLSGSFKEYQKLKAFEKKKEVSFFYGASVGAGLPILATLKNLVLSGDKILKIEAVVSGTLSYLFNEISAKKPFSVVLKEAIDLGFCEPDPRADLSGEDVVRKLVILARESGYPLEQDAIVKEELFLKEELLEGSLEEFYKKLEDFDLLFEKKRALAEKNKQVLRYSALLEEGVGKVALLSVGQEHPFYFLTQSDNIFVLTTENYQKTPLVIKGKGAGPEVTASAMIAEILR